MFLGTITAHEIRDPNNISFDPKMYSKLKFGCRSSAEVMGKELAEEFIKQDTLYNKVDIDKPLLITPSAYNVTPISSVLLKDSFCYHISSYLNKIGIKLSEFKINRVYNYVEDYAKMNVETREKMIINEKLLLDSRLVNNSTIIFLDDIRVTGTHEKLMERTIDSTVAEFDHIFVYYASVNSNIKPTIEDALNRSAIKHLADILPIVNSKYYTITKRLVRFVLSQSHDDIQNFLNECGKDVVTEIRHACLYEGYHNKAEFRDSFNIINKNFNNL